MTSAAWPPSQVEHRALVLTLAFTAVSGGAKPWRSGCATLQFLRRRLNVHDNAVQLGVDHAEGLTKSAEERSVPVPQFVLDELSVQCQGRAID